MTERRTNRHTLLQRTFALYASRMGRQTIQLENLRLKTASTSTSSSRNIDSSFCGGGRGGGGGEDGSGGIDGPLEISGNVNTIIFDEK